MSGQGLNRQFFEGSRLTNIPVPEHSLKSDGHGVFGDCGTSLNEVISAKEEAESYGAFVSSGSSFLCGQGLNLHPFNGFLLTKIPLFLHSLKSEGHGISD